MSAQMSWRPCSAPARAHVTTVPGPTVQAANMDQVSREMISFPATWNNIMKIDSLEVVAQ